MNPVPAETPNYDCVNDVVPDNDDSYVNSWYDFEGLSCYSLDYYLKEAFALPAGATITNVRIVQRSRSENATYKVNCSERMKLAATIYDGDTHAFIDTSYAEYYSDWAKSPATGLDWTEDEINSLIMGINITCRKRSVYLYYYGRCTQAYVEVTYTVPAAVKPALRNLLMEKEWG
jgi:hypothetical protein